MEQAAGAEPAEVAVDVSQVQIAATSTPLVRFRESCSQWVQLALAWPASLCKDATVLSVAEEKIEGCGISRPAPRRSYPRGLKSAWLTPATPLITEQWRTVICFALNQRAWRAGVTFSPVYCNFTGPPGLRRLEERCRVLQEEVDKLRLQAGSLLRLRVPCCVEQMCEKPCANSAGVADGAVSVHILQVMTGRKNIAAAASSSGGPGARASAVVRDSASLEDKPAGPRRDAKQAADEPSAEGRGSPEGKGRLQFTKAGYVQVKDKEWAAGEAVEGCARS